MFAGYSSYNSKFQKIRIFKQKYISAIETLRWNCQNLKKIKFFNKKSYLQHRIQTKIISSKERPNSNYKNSKKYQFSKKIIFTR